MNGIDYGPQLKQFEKEDTAEGKLNCICAMFEMLVTNHLPHIERNQKLNRKWLLIIGGLVLLGQLFSNQVIIRW